MPTARFSLANLKTATQVCAQCRNEPTHRLHDVIKARFEQVLNKCFRQVPSYPELLVFETKSEIQNSAVQV